jgi:hypothetical protein
MCRTGTSPSGGLCAYRVELGRPLSRRFPPFGHRRLPRPEETSPGWGRGREDCLDWRVIHPRGRQHCYRPAALKRSPSSPQRAQSRNRGSDNAGVEKAAEPTTANPSSADDGGTRAPGVDAAHRAFRSEYQRRLSGVFRRSGRTKGLWLHDKALRRYMDLDPRVSLAPGRCARSSHATAPRAAPTHPTR